MIKVNQGDTSDIIALTSSGDFKMTKEWSAKLVIVSSKSNTRPLLEKCFTKDYVNNRFYTALLPNETGILIPGNYIMGFQIENELFCYRKEIHEKLKILPQVVFSTYSTHTSGCSGCIPTCPYTSNGLPPSGDRIFYDPTFSLEV